MKLEALLSNKYVLYTILVLAVTNVFGYIAVGNNDALILFFVLGVLISYFSKNMIVILLCAMLLTNFIIISRNGAAKLTSRVESMSNKENSEKKPRIDQAATFQQAFKDLENNLTPDQMKSLKSDTQDLIKTQQQLGESIKEIGPLINTANNMMQMLGSAGAPVSKLLDQVSGLLGSAKTTANGEIDISKIDLKGISDQAQTLAEQSKKIADSQAAQRS